MSPMLRWVRRQLAGVLSIVVVLSLFAVGQLPSLSAAELRALSDEYAFSPLAIAMPAGLPTQSLRDVNQDYDHIRAWVSSVGAGIAMNDMTGDGRANDLCITDPRIDETVLTPVPRQDGTPRYAPFVLDPDPLPVDDTMAPMGCVPGDYNADGRMDVLVYYWGRTPIVWLAREGADPTGPDAYRPVEMVDDVSADGEYHGPLWNTNAVAVADYDGDGYEDVYVGNYWPHGPVLDDRRSGGVAMPASLSHARNGGKSYIYRWTGGEGGTDPTVSYTRATEALPDDAAAGWALAASAADVDGDVLPELYLAHDFGPDQLLHNRSRPGDLAFEPVVAPREPMTPKSKLLGRSSFKGMGVDFGDLSGDGLPEIFVSNITTSYGIQESNFAFFPTEGDRAQLGAALAEGTAPYEDRSGPLKLAWSGWGWDAKIADLNNSGNAEVVQATGFVQGQVDRWPQLQEMATTNDDLVSDPSFWPNVEAGDDLAGNQTPAFFAPTADGHYEDLSGPLGLAKPIPTRGIALGDADGDGLLDMAFARQWEAPVFYRNDSPAGHQFVGLRLTRESTGSADAPGSPVVGAQALVTTGEGDTYWGRVDGGGGHSGKRSHEIVVGLGDAQGPYEVTLTWRDRAGEVHRDTVSLAAGWHDLRLGTQAHPADRDDRDPQPGREERS